MVFFVIELIYKCLIGFLLFILFKIRWVISLFFCLVFVVIIIFLIFLFKIKDFIILNCLFVLLIIIVFIFLGMIGKFFKFYFLYEGLYCLGVVFVIRCFNV